MVSVLKCVDDSPTLNQWRELICRSAVPLDLRVDPDPGFCGQIVSGEFGAARINDFVHPPLEAFRTPALIRRSDPELCKIEVAVCGQVVIEQNDREALLRPGDFTLIDTSRPSRVGANAEGRATCMLFPRSILPLSPEEMARLIATRVPGSDGVGALISSLARQLARNLDDLPDADGIRLSTAAFALLATLLADWADRSSAVPQDMQRRALTHRIHVFIEEHLADPELKPAMVAAAHHISLRYLYKLFQAEGKSPSGWIRDRRLERCRQDLLTSGLLDRPVSAVAARWGFVHPAHFTRLFRATYQLSPGEYRRMHIYAHRS
jgi:AraC-like DNA-binding protein